MRVGFAGIRRAESRPRMSGGVPASTSSGDCAVPGRMRTEPPTSGRPPGGRWCEARSTTIATTGLGMTRFPATAT